MLADARPLLYGNEAIWRDGRVVGYVTSGAYGHHLGAAVGLGYVACEAGETARDLLASDYAIEVGSERIAARPPTPSRAAVRPQGKSGCVAEA
jgi:4-methylaminobutanoate oxidase (formaldehyde-forming)